MCSSLVKLEISPHMPDAVLLRKELGGNQLTSASQQKCAVHHVTDAYHEMRQSLDDAVATV